MYNENYSIIFSSMTGNTRKLADKIHEILPKESCDYFGTADAQVIKSEFQPYHCGDDFLMSSTGVAILDSICMQFIAIC